METATWGPLFWKVEIAAVAHTWSAVHLGYDKRFKTIQESSKMDEYWVRYETKVVGVQMEKYDFDQIHTRLSNKMNLIYIYLYLQYNLLYFYLIPWVLVSTSKYLWTHEYSRTREFLTCGSKSPGGWNPHRSKYGISKLKYPWVRIQVTHKCTRAHP